MVGVVKCPGNDRGWLVVGMVGVLGVVTCPGNDSRWLVCLRATDDCAALLNSIS